jgi:hypothetical protein
MKPRVSLKAFEIPRTSGSLNLIFFIYQDPPILWFWNFSNTQNQWFFGFQFFSNTQKWRVLQNADTHPRLKWMWLEDWLIPGQGWLMFSTTKARFVFCWCAWHGHKAMQQRTKDVIVVYANFTTSKCIFVCQMLSLDFEWIHWSHWRGCSDDLVNSLVHWTRTSELNPHFIL